MRRPLALMLLLAAPLPAAPRWKAPAELPFGALSVLELAEDDPAAPPLPRPGEERLGPLVVRGVDPLPDGRGWRLTVQPVEPGPAVIPAMDLGDGRAAPELRVTVPRTTPYGAPWMGLGGGREDLLDALPFPWWWALAALSPLLLPAWLLLRRWRRSAGKRRLRQLRRTFAQAWPPASKAREALDAAHGAGRTLLAARYGEEARAWGVAAFREQHLEAWAAWCASLDAARFGRTEPPFPPLKALLDEAEARRC